MMQLQFYEMARWEESREYKSYSETIKFALENRFKGKMVSKRKKKNDKIASDNTS